MKKTFFRLVEALIVGAALVVLTVRYTASDVYQEYRRTGGRNGFWSWFVKEKCGVSLPGVEDEDEKFAAEEKKAKAKDEREKKAKLAQLEAREKELVAADILTQAELDERLGKLRAELPAWIGVVHRDRCYQGAKGHAAYECRRSMSRKTEHLTVQG